MNQKTLQALETQGYTGPDASLETSLGEYGLAWNQEKNSITFLYGIQADDSGNWTRFDWASYQNLDPAHEWDWALKPEFYDHNGIEPEEWTQQSTGLQVLDLILYYGYENIFGSSYTEGFEIKGLNQ